MKNIKYIVDVEVHIRNYKNTPAYHAHVFFDSGTSTETVINQIDRLNVMLDQLYPKKMVSDEDNNVPSLEEIVKKFDEFDLLILPHGGQSHRSFDKSIPSDIKFDSVIERNVYYNQFDGFTSRSNTRLERTHQYFEKLGISSFINLITCSDNYTPEKYPNTKAKNTEAFIPTWLISEPTFSGLRLALSESSRLKYQTEIPSFTNDYIKSVKLETENIHIDVNLTNGLNVIIGGSSTGKTLFMDSIYKKISNSFDSDKDNPYDKYKVKDIFVDNPANYVPHYIQQNYITKVIDEKYDDGIEKIDIIKNTFKGNVQLDEQVNAGLAELNHTLTTLITSVENIQTAINNMKGIPSFPRIISNNTLNINPYELLLPSSEVKDSINISKVMYASYIKTLDEIKQLSINNPFISNLSTEIDKIEKSIKMAYEKQILFNKISEEIEKYKKEFDNAELKEKANEVTNKNSRDTLLNNIELYIKNLNVFYQEKEKLGKFSIEYSTEPIETK